MATETGTFSVSLEQLSAFEFKVRFDGLSVPDVVVDEPEPLGHGAGPNASRVLAAAVANCLSASLLFCLTKCRVDAGGIRATVTGQTGRTPEGRLRIQQLDVRIALGADLADNPHLKRCLGLFEDYCVVTASVRQGIPVRVQVANPDGTLLLDRPAG